MGERQLHQSKAKEQALETNIEGHCKVHDEELKYRASLKANVLHLEEARTNLLSCIRNIHAQMTGCWATFAQMPLEIPPDPYFPTVTAEILVPGASTPDTHS